MATKKDYQEEPVLHGDRKRRKTVNKSYQMYHSQHHRKMDSGNPLNIAEVIKNITGRDKK